MNNSNLIFNKTIEAMHSQLSDNSIETMISFPANRGLKLIEPNAILYLQSESNYTHIYFTDGSTNFLSKTLKYLSSYLPEKQFIRIHHSYIINKKFITTFKKSNLTLNDTISVPVSRKFDISSILE